jgi:hypothetical protein
MKITFTILVSLVLAGTTPAGILDKLVPRDYRLEKMVAETMTRRPKGCYSSPESDIEIRLDRIQWQLDKIESARRDAEFWQTLYDLGWRP